MNEKKEQTGIDILKKKKVSELTKDEVLLILCEAYKVPKDKYYNVIYLVMRDSQNAARYTTIVNFIANEQQKTEAIANSKKGDA